MKLYFVRTAVALALVALTSACSTVAPNSPGLMPARDTATPVKDVKISTDFRDEGVKIYYTMTGAVDRIEVMGMAPAWRGNVDIIAEADAMDDLAENDQ